MKFLHVFTDSNDIYVEAFYRLIYTNFDTVNHHFIYYGSLKKNSSIVNLNIDVFDSNSVKMRDIIHKRINNFDKILFHKLNEQVDFMYYYFKLGLKKKKKIIWIVWGADLYSWKRTTHHKNIVRKIKNLCYNFISKQYRKRIKQVVSSDIDYREYERIVGKKIAKKSYIYGVYPLGFSNNTINQALANNYHVSPRKRIMIGHSSSKELNHFEVLNKLNNNYYLKNYEIVIPLAYGDIEYTKSIETSLNKFHNLNITVIKDKLSMENYIRFLSTIDYAIFNSSRQIGLGNIYMLIALHKKLIFPEESILFKYFNEKYSYVFPLSIINGSTDFVNIDNPKFILSNKIYELLDESTYIKIWKNIFSELR